MMATTTQILKAIKSRLYGMKEEAKLRQRPGLKQQIEELQHLVEMLEAHVADA